MRMMSSLRALGRACVFSRTYHIGARLTPG
jgi:hypothetical protein